MGEGNTSIHLLLESLDCVWSLNQFWGPVSKWVLISALGTAQIEDLEMGKQPDMLKGGSLSSVLVRSWPRSELVWIHKFHG